MMNNFRSSPLSKNLSDETKLRYAIDFLEELSWLVESRKKLNLKEIPEILRDRLLRTEPDRLVADSHVSPNPNIHYLIGVLPGLFMDERLFGKNDEIADFARDVLGVKISRIEKRSKYELIGLIVCETSTLNDAKLKNMVGALSYIATNKDKLAKIAEEKSSTGFSWNHAIRKIAIENDT